MLKNKKIFKRVHKRVVGASFMALAASFILVNMYVQHRGSMNHVYAQAVAERVQQDAAVDSAQKSTANSKISTPRPSAATNVVPKPTLAATPAQAAPTQTVAAAVPSSSSLYVNSSANVNSKALAWAAADPNSSAIMRRLAATPMANWFGDWNSDIQGATSDYVGAATNAKQIPVLVAYNIPERDCSGGYSAGGATSAANYKAWITSFAAGIGQRQAIVIVEPDALAGMDCLSAGDQQSRLQLLSFAAQTLQSQTKAAIYLDAGNSNWQSAAVMAGRLKSAGIASATGFSLNVSNFETTSSNTTYGTNLSQLLGGKHFVIDTSRNGNGPSTGPQAWCNPDGRAFGALPTLETGNSQTDAYLWIKSPGESDGACGASQQGSSPPGAGTWWPQYALMLARNSGW